MKVRAKELNQALKAFGKVEKTVSIEEFSVITDKAAGTEKRKKSKVTHHAVIRLWVNDECPVTVDIDKLRKLTKSLGDQVVDVRVRDTVLYFTYSSGDFCLIDMDVSSTVELDLSALTEGSDASLMG